MQTRHVSKNNNMQQQQNAPDRFLDRRLNKNWIVQSPGAVRKHHFQHVRNVSWLQMSVSACLKRAVVKNVRFSMAGICRGQKHQIEHGWNVLWSKTSDSACP
jgi:hypothetical protein